MHKDIRLAVMLNTFNTVVHEVHVVYHFTYCQITEDSKVYKVSNLSLIHYKIFNHVQSVYSELLACRKLIHWKYH